MGSQPLYVNLSLVYQRKLYVLYQPIHALSGCDTTSKVGSKLQAFNAAYKAEHPVLVDFGVKTLDDDIPAERE